MFGEYGRVGMRGFWTCLLLIGLLCGCQNQPSQPPQGNAGNDPSEVSDSANGPDGGVRNRDAWQTPANSGSGSGLQNPLVRGFGQLADDTTIFQGDTGIGEMLAEADAAISDIKEENSAALKDLNRQIPLGARKPPNIVVVLTDDVGYGELGCYGQQKIKTPHLDSLAANGARLTDFYAGATTDAASRWCLMTGFDTSRADRRSTSPFSLEPQQVTLGETLWQAGYSTAFVGYWGLGNSAENMPHLHGFDEWFGTLAREPENPDYPEKVWSNGAAVRLVENEKQLRGQYLPSVVISEAISVIKRRPAGRPLLLIASLARPTDAPKIDTYDTMDWPSEHKSYAAALTRMDQDVGRLMHELDQQGLTKETVFVFLSDNGAPTDTGASQAFFASNGGLQGGQGSLYEGGLRVPAIVRWPGRIPPGSVVSDPFAIWDLPTTLADFAGALRRPKQTDGISMVSALRGGAAPSREMLYWEAHQAGVSQAVRIGKWKVVRPAGRERREDIELYDLSIDPGERSDVSKQNPEIVAKFIR